MKLNPGERSILASFSAGPKAETALRELKAAGFGTTQLDRVGRYGFRPDTDQQRPAIAGKEESLTAAVLSPAQLDEESAVLLAATPEASGLADPVTEDRGPFLLTVVTDEAGVSEAVEIIQRHGGIV